MRELKGIVELTQTDVCKEKWGRVDRKKFMNTRVKVEKK